MPSNRLAALFVLAAPWALAPAPAAAQPLPTAPPAAPVAPPPPATPVAPPPSAAQPIPPDLPPAPIAPPGAPPGTPAAAPVLRPPGPPAPPPVVPGVYPYPDPGALPPDWEAPAPPKKNWYGWQILLGVAASDVLMIAGAASSSGALAAVGGVAHLVSGPVVHFAHRKWGTGGASIGLNIGAPVVTGLIGFGLGFAFDGCGSGGGDVCGVGAIFGATLGVYAGVTAATIVDVAVLAYDTPRTPEQARKAPGPTLSLAPLLGSGQKGLGLVGTF